MTPPIPLAALALNIASPALAEGSRVDPRYTEGWLARVRSLAKVVAGQGTIDLSLFARADGAPDAQR